MLFCKRFHWSRLLAAAAMMTGMLVRADEPFQAGIQHSVRRPGPMLRSAGVPLVRPAQSPFEILQASGAEPEPAPAEDPVGTALVQMEDSAPPPVPVPPPATMSPSAGSDSLISGVAEVRYISSAWPGTWRPSVCSDIAFQQLGASVVGAMGRQIYRGSVELMTLYDFDFHGADTVERTELTSRGRYQLEKYARRLEFIPSPIKVQIADSDPALDAARREQVVRQLSDWGIPNADTLVVLGRVRFGVPATEAVQTAEGLERVIETRGRSVTPDTSARFGTGRSTSGFAR